MKVTAAEVWSVNMIKKLAEKYPDRVKVIAINEDGSIYASVPFEWMRIAPKRTRTMTDEQKAAAIERMSLAREKKGNKNEKLD